MVTTADERRRAPAGDSRWAESWWFDFAARDASLGGFARLSVHPHQGIAWCWAALVGDGRRLLLVRDQDLQAPRGQSLDVRGQGLWLSATCETPLEHWSVGLEAFAVAFDDPREALVDERGDLVGLGLDLEWEASGPAADVSQTAYCQPCRVSGEILVADEQLAFDGVGFRGHRWGIQDWWQAAGEWSWGLLEGGEAFCAGSGGGTEPWAMRWRANAAEDLDLAAGAVSVTCDADGMLAGARVGSESEGSLAESVVGTIPVLVEPVGGPRARLLTGLARCRAAGGGQGVGWVARLVP